MVKLTTDNHLLWRAQVLLHLRSHYLEGFINGSHTFPPAMVTMTSASGNPVSVVNPAHRQWVDPDQAILGALQSSLTLSIAGIVIFAATSREVWSTLESSFSSQYSAHAMASRNKLGKIKKRELTTQAFYKKGKSLANMFSSIGQPLCDSEFIVFILNGLDKEYDSFVENVTRREVPITPSDLLGRILSTE
jgi:hypothetical protein